MKNKSSSIPVAMVMRKFYCHHCGERLEKSPRKRIIRRGDPDYREHSTIGHTHMIGDVELTEYDFKCPNCDKIIGYNEQRVMEKIQKHVGKHTLSQAEIDEHIENAKAVLEKEKKRDNIIAKVISIALIIFMIYMWLKSGDFSFKFYF